MHLTNPPGVKPQSKCIHTSMPPHPLLTLVPPPSSLYVQYFLFLIYIHHLRIHVHHSFSFINLYYELLTPFIYPQKPTLSVPRPPIFISPFFPYQILNHTHPNSNLLIPQMKTGE